MTDNPLLDIARLIADEEQALKDTIDALLNERRPDRYSHGEWLEEISRNAAVIEHLWTIERLKRVRSVVVRSVVEGIDEPD